MTLAELVATFDREAQQAKIQSRSPKMRKKKRINEIDERALTSRSGENKKTLKNIDDRVIERSPGTKNTLVSEGDRARTSRSVKSTKKNQGVEQAVTSRSVKKKKTNEADVSRAKTGQSPKRN